MRAFVKERQSEGDNLPHVQPLLRDTPGQKLGFGPPDGFDMPKLFCGSGSGIGEARLGLMMDANMARKYSEGIFIFFMVE